jgi:UDP-N-acetyl-D-mannosaminuronate dehydrogenase
MDDSVALEDLLGWADLVIIVTAHRAIDLAAVYDRADLILDTVNASRGRTPRTRQVLRLGAGWS